jgi:DNA-binding phage protein
MSIKTTPFNPMDFLKADDEIAAYLTEAYRDDDPAVFLNFQWKSSTEMGHCASFVESDES